MKLALAFLLPVLASGQKPPDVAPSAREVMRSAARGNLGRDETSQISLVLENDRGGHRVRSLTRWYLRAADQDRTLVRFQKPADISGTALLTHQTDGEEAEQWLYLPALKRPKRIVSSDSTGYFVETDLTYQDLRIEELEDHRYEGPARERVGEAECYRVTAIPKDEGVARRTGYSKRVLWIDAKTRVVLRVHFHDLSGRLAKTLEASAVKDFGGKSKATQFVIENLLRRHKTYLRIDKLVLDSGLDPELLGQARLGG